MEFDKKAVRDIRRKTRRKFAPEEKVRKQEGRKLETGLKR
jgi:hypothetical protein